MKRRAMEKRILWKKHLEINEAKFNNLVSFLKTNHARVENFHLTSAYLELVMRKSAKEKIYFLFLGCLNAAGGDNLSATGEACQKMRDALIDLQDSPQIAFAAFIATLKSPNEINNSKELFDYLRGGAFRNMRYKKAALFMKSIYYAQLQMDIRIFFDLEPSNIYRPIPLDTIIGEIMSVILALPYSKRISSGDAFDFEKFARDELGDDYYILEDIWFWGFFGTRIRKDNYRIIEYNEVKYLTDRTFFPKQDDVFEREVKEFCKIVNGVQTDLHIE